MFNSHPKINIEPNSTDRKILRVGWITVALNFLLVAIFYFDLPQTIPIHFNLKGEADGFGNRTTIWALPILSVLLYYGMYQITTRMKPWNYNYPLKVNTLNAPKLYSMSIRMVVWINLGISLLFFLISLHTILLVNEVKVIDLGWFILFCTILITLFPFYIIFKMFKLPKK